MKRRVVLTTPETTPEHAPLYIVVLIGEEEDYLLLLILTCVWNPEVEPQLDVDADIPSISGYACVNIETDGQNKAPKNGEVEILHTSILEKVFKVHINFEPICYPVNQITENTLRPVLAVGGLGIKL